MRVASSGARNVLAWLACKIKSHFQRISGLRIHFNYIQIMQMEYIHLCAVSKLTCKLRSSACRAHPCVPVHDYVRGYVCVCVGCGCGCIRNGSKVHESSSFRCRLKRRRRCMDECILTNTGLLVYACASRKQ